jgi:methionyl-tRNA synthetase
VKQPRQLVVTCALLYANGPLHLGHLLEHIQADIWVRFQRLQGNNCYFISGEDAHGTPIMLAAEAQHISPEALVQSIFTQHKRDLTGFYISFDDFGTTHCAENEKLVRTIYQRLLEKGDIAIRTADQAYDPERKLFLPDRYIKGICPHCNAKDQYGDNCEHCGATYEALELKEPFSVLSGAKPIAKSSEQYFFILNHYHDFLRNWIEQDTLPLQTQHKLLEWFKHPAGLRDLAISREAPYLGFHIPNTRDKYFYVWIDAPVGYMAIFQQLCAQRANLNFDDYWKPDTHTELYHVIGKDIVKFHALFWPAMLKGAGFRLPTRLFIHGFLTIEGRKMSKSRGTFITVQQYLRHLNPEYLRYYLASKFNGTVEDINLNWTDFTQKINTDCVGKFVNIASRCAKLLETYCDNQLSSTLDEMALFTHFSESGINIAQDFENQQYSQAIRHIMELADQANQYLAQKKPWVLAKDPTKGIDMQKVCTTGLNLFKMLATYLKPVLPKVADQVAQFLKLSDLQWQDRAIPLLGSSIQPYQPLLERITPMHIEALLQDSPNS